MTTKQEPIATLDNWSLYLLGFVKENIRKAILFNALSRQEFLAKVLIEKDNKRVKYTVIEAVDPIENVFVDIKKTFVLENNKNR